jgi:hypothetical protein
MVDAPAATDAVTTDVLAVDAVATDAATVDAATTTATATTVAAATATVGGQRHSMYRGGELVVAVDVVSRFEKLMQEHEKLWKCQERPSSSLPSTGLRIKPPT